MIIEIATLATNIGLCCFGADVILVDSNKSKLPITNLYIDISYKVISNAMRAVYSFPGGKVIIAAVSALAAKDVGLIDYAAKKVEVCCFEPTDSYSASLKCYDNGCFLSQFDNRINFTGELSVENNNLVTD